MEKDKFEIIQKSIIEIQKAIAQHTECLTGGWVEWLDSKDHAQNDCSLSEFMKWRTK